MKVFVDVESTGKYYQDRDSVISLAMVCGNDEFYQKCKPLYFKDDMAIHIHGISVFEMQRAQSPSDMFSNALDWLLERDDQHEFWAHQLNGFDWRFILSTLFQISILDGHGMYFKWLKLFDTYNVQSTITLGRESGYKKNSLALWQQRLKFELDHHDALSDARGCKYVHDFLLGEKHEYKRVNSGPLFQS